VNKPRLYLDRAEFEAESDNAFLIYERDGGGAIQGRFDGETHELTGGETLRYRTPLVDVALDRESLAVQSIDVRVDGADEVHASLVPAAWMLALLDGVRDSLPWLPAGPDS
jgi:hypothetical protein